MSELSRPAFHFTPPSMWLNDPNGLVYLDGEYHLFYQYHPHSTVWGPMHWGHAISRDLIHWEHLPIALYPDEFGMVFSGSAVVDVQNTAGFGKNALVAIFTYNKDYRETQNLAYSTDRGRTWTKYAGNPVIPEPDPLGDCRDPKVFWHEDHWVLLLAAKDKVLFFSSPNLKDWQLTGEFGNGFGSTEGVWETPDLFLLPVNASDSRWVLTVGLGKGSHAGGSGTQYFVGEFNGKTFTSENPKETVLWMDYGADFYAPQSWSNEPHGRRIMLAWMSNWQYALFTPTEPWRGQFSLPREVTLAQTDEGIRLRQQPPAETSSLRGKNFHWQNVDAVPAENLLREIHGSTFEIDVKFQLAETTQVFGFRVRKGSENHTTIGFDARSNEIFIDRTQSGMIDFYEGFAARHTVKMKSPAARMHIFADRSSVEVFVNDGIVCLSDLIYPSPESLDLEIFTEGDTVHLMSLDVYQLENHKAVL